MRIFDNNVPNLRPAAENREYARLALVNIRKQEGAIKDEKVIIFLTNLAREMNKDAANGLYCHTETWITQKERNLGLTFVDFMKIKDEAFRILRNYGYVCVFGKHNPLLTSSEGHFTISWRGGSI